MVIICANSLKGLPKEKFCQVKVGSNIAQNRLCSRSHMLSLFIPVHVKSLPKVKFIQILLKIVPNLTFKSHPRSKVIQFKDHEVN